eukprot:jgi/Tetstr1/421637/TSEL_012577.t1
MMQELRRLWHLLDTHDIIIRPRYIQSAANVWADRLAAQPLHYLLLATHLGTAYGRQIRLMENAQLPRYYSRWRAPRSETVESLHLPDAFSRRERNYCNPQWTLLDDMVAKLCQSCAAATVVAPHWPGRRWNQQLLELSDETIVYPPTHDLFFPDRLGARVGAGRPAWSLAAFQLPLRPGFTPGGGP